MTDATNPGREAAGNGPPRADSDSTNETQPSPKKPKKAVPQRWLIVVLVLTFAFVLMPYLFWQATWFGRPLDDAQMAKAFADTQQPREAQHALSQIADRMENANPATRASAKSWYPQVVVMASSSESALRSTAAWVMGKDPTSPEFHQALTKLSTDSDPMVQRNAALSLVRFGDTSGHDLIVSMLKPWVLSSPATGKLAERLTVSEAVNVGTLVGRIENTGDKVEIRTKMPGTLDLWLVKDGTEVSAGQPIAELDPGSDVVLNALTGLYFIGRPDDISAIAPYTRGVPGMPPSVAQQAQMTLNAIHSRPASAATPTTTPGAH
ncbi:MAG TPA: hypothetical protein VN774_07705 [Candidatus Limnocylindrales bacterium]|nr:hypothetical protein [Candidatus Limnocylindrales bacterium]